jgi:hypothetical protein
VTAYDFGSPAGVPDSLRFYPSENAISVSQTPRGGVILPPNVVAVRPNPKVLGFVGARSDTAVHALGTGHGDVRVRVMNSNDVPDGHLFVLTMVTPHPDSIRATSYTLRDSTSHTLLFTTGYDIDGAGIGPVGEGLLPIVTNPLLTVLDTARTRFDDGSATNLHVSVVYQKVLDQNLRRPGYPDDITITFDDVVRDTSIESGVDFTPLPAKFIVVAHTPAGDRRLDFRFKDRDHDGTLSRAGDYIDILTEFPVAFRDSQSTWRVEVDTTGQSERGPIIPPRLGDVFQLRPATPLTAGDVFTFSTVAQHVDAGVAKGAWGNEKPYVVPNPYVGAASFEPARFAVSGRGDRRMEFRSIPLGAVIRIYTVRGELVQTLRQDGTSNGFVPWDLRTKDNLDIAPGLFVYHVEGPGVGDYVGKFAIIK